MTDQHDPLCEFPDERLCGAFCECRLIGRVRADERERIAQELEQRQGLDNAAWFVRHYGPSDGAGDG